MRWLLLKDLRILRRSPLLSGLLIVYPIAVALMIGFALSSPPGKPKVALYSGVPTGHSRVRLGAATIDVSRYAAELDRSITPIHARTAAAAIADVRDGRAVAAIIVPADIVSQIRSLIEEGVGSPSVRIILNAQSPLEREFADEAIQTRLDTVQRAISRQVLDVALSDLREVLDGGSLSFLGQRVNLLGLRNARTIVDGAIAALPRHSALVPALRQVVSFADIAIAGLGFASPVVGDIATPLHVQTTELAGRTTPTAAYAVAIAVVVSLMFVALLLASGMLALERSENAYRRLVPELLRPESLLGEKVVLAAGCAALLAFGLSAVVSIFVTILWSRVELWVGALVLAGLAFGALGVALGALARDVSAASLLAFLLSLPIAFLALVPATAVSGGLGHVLSVVSFLFPFRAGLDAVGNAFTGTAPGIGLPLLHLAVLALVYVALARLALRRFVDP